MRRAIIKHDGTRREENIWHCWMGAGRGTHLQPPSPPSSSAQERLCFDLQLELSAAPQQINQADAVASLAQALALFHIQWEPQLSPSFSVTAH